MTMETYLRKDGVMVTEGAGHLFDLRVIRWIMWMLLGSTYDHMIRISRCILIGFA